MAAIAAAAGGASALAGLWGSWLFDTPTGPSIVCVAAGLFGLSALAGLVRRSAA
jgi:zinc transport system permease protein